LLWRFFIVVRLKISESLCCGGFCSLSASLPAGRQGEGWGEAIN